MARIKTYNLYESYELKGYWFLPNKETGEQERFAGILILSPDDIKLKLFESNISPWGDLCRYDVINGELLNGEKVTLVDAFWTGSPETTDIISGYCVIGQNYSSKDDILFDSFFVYQKDLRNWIMKRTASMERQEKKLEITIDFPEKDFDINVNDNLNISNFYNTNYCRDVFKDPAFEQKVYINFKSIKTPFALNEIIIEHLFTWNILFSIMVGRVCNIDYLIGVKDKQNIHIFYRKEHYNNDDIIAHWMILPFYSIKDDLENILKSWFNEQEEKIIYAKELFMDGFINTNQLTKEGFLNLFQAIEGIAELLEQSYHLDKVTLKELQEKIDEFLKSKGINSKARSSFKSRVVGLNEKKSADDLLKRLILKNIDLEILQKLKIDEDYIRRMTDVRRHLSHNKGSNYDSIISFQEFHNMLDKMVIILIYYFAVSNCVPKEIANEGILERSHWISNFIRHLEK